MVSLRIVSLLVLLAAFRAIAEPAAIAYEVVATYPQNEDAFTQGLYFDGDGLLLGTGQYGKSSLRRVDLASGRTLQNVKLGKRFFGEGIARHGDVIYQLTWKSGVAFTYNARTLKAGASLSYRGQGWGITSDGRTLITSSGNGTLIGRDPANFAPVWSLQVTRAGRRVTGLNELEFINNRIYANVWKSNEVLVINPISGAVESVLDLSVVVTDMKSKLPGVGVLNGIAFDARRNLVLVTGKNWRLIYALRLGAE